MSSDNKIMSQLSQVTIKLLAAKIIIKSLFSPVTPVTAPRKRKYGRQKAKPFLVGDQPSLGSWAFFI